MAKALSLLLLLIISPAVYAVTHNVGGNSGWTTNFNYDNWASRQTFNVDDTLVFTYGPSHQVFEVSKSDYDNCNTGNPITSSNGSPTTVSLSAAGTRYFICPTSNHCSIGMKLTVTTVAGSTPTPGGPPPPPGTPAAPTGAPGTENPSPPPPPPPPQGSSGWRVAGSSSMVVAAAILGMIMG